MKRVRFPQRIKRGSCAVIKPAELDVLLPESPYYLGPDGPVAEEGFAVMVQALTRSGRIGIGRVVLNGKEKLIALKPQGKGFMFFTLRPASEVRAAGCFDDLADRQLDDAQVALAVKLVESKCAPFNPAAFTDRYQTALLDLIKAKIDGSEPVVMPPNQTLPVISFLDALRQSIEGEQVNGTRKNGKAANGSRNGKNHRLGSSASKPSRTRQQVIDLAQPREIRIAIKK